MNAANNSNVVFGILVFFNIVSKELSFKEIPTNTFLVSLPDEYYLNN